MSKEPIPLVAADISVFARSLKQQLREGEALPSHLSLMNMLARAAGFRNYQHMRAARAAEGRLAVDALPEVADYRLVERTLNQFDGAGCLLRWPSRRPVQELCLWAMWAVVPPARHLQERDVNAALNAAHVFGDAASLRRSLFGMGLVSRKRDGSDYLRVEKSPPVEAREVIRRLKARRQATAVQRQTA